MGIFDRLKGQAQKEEEKDPNLASEGLDKAGQEANQMTGGRHGDQINQGMQTAQNTIGQQSGPQDQNQGSQDPNQPGYQDATQGGGFQNQNQDPNQPGYQDPTQGGGFQNQNQGYQDPNQPGYQDPTQSASQETGYDPEQDPYQDHTQGRDQ